MLLRINSIRAQFHYNSGLKYIITITFTYTAQTGDPGRGPDEHHEQLPDHP